MKFPVYFLHLWLPKAHVEAPTTARILLASLLLKLGGCGFLHILSLIKVRLNYFWLFLSYLGIVLCCLICISQRDIKSLVAYSSVRHIRFLLLVFVILNIFSDRSGFLLMVGHGFTSGLLFYLVGEVYSYLGNRKIYYFLGGLISSIYFRLLIRLGILSNSGFPISVSFYFELVRILSLLIVNYFFVLLLFIYFILTFYYCIYFMVCGLIGKFFLNLNLIKINFSFIIVLISYNILIFIFVYFKSSFFYYSRI